MKYEQYASIKSGLQQIFFTETRVYLTLKEYIPYRSGYSIKYHIAEVIEVKDKSQSNAVYSMIRGHFINFVGEYFTGSRVYEYSGKNRPDIISYLREEFANEIQS